MNKLKIWFEGLRVPFFTATVIPVILGTLIAWKQFDVFNLSYFVLTLFGILFLHAGTNMVNDYFDHKSGNDEINKEFVRPFTGGSRVIQKGLLKPNQVLTVALLFFFIGSLVGLYLAWLIGIEILFLGLIGVFSAFFYSAPPFRFSDRGLGEFFVGINFGVLVVLGSYFVQAKSFALEPILAAFPISLLIAAVLYINEFPDYTADKAVGKDNLVVRLGKEKAVNGYVFLMGLVFTSTAVFAGLKLISPFTLLIFLMLPLALKSIKIVKLYYNQTLNLVSANRNTIIIHLCGGLLLSLGYLIDKLIL